jgi:ketosteroid isomerase-like protein
MSDNRTVLEQYGQAMSASDTEAQDRLLTDDFVEEYPQSGEIIRGKANRRAIIENYPGGTPRDATAQNQRPPQPQITGSGDNFTAVSRITYPNGETWQYVGLFQFRGGKIARITSYFAAPFEAPAWRAPYVEKAPAEARSR